MSSEPPLWFIDDEDEGHWVRAPDEAAAIAQAREHGCEGDLTAILDDGAPLGGERKPRPSRALVPAGIPRPEIGMMAWLSITGLSGMRCPTCGRFAREHDFTGAATAAAFRVPGGVARVDFAPSCWRCRGLPAAPYAGVELVTPAYTLEPGASGGGG